MTWRVCKPFYHQLRLCGRTIAAVYQNVAGVWHFVTRDGRDTYMAGEAGFASSTEARRALERHLKTYPGLVESTLATIRAEIGAGS